MSSTEQKRKNPSILRKTSEAIITFMSIMRATRERKSERLCRNEKKKYYMRVVIESENNVSANSFLSYTLLFFLIEKKKKKFSLRSYLMKSIITDCRQNMIEFHNQQIILTFHKRIDLCRF